MTGFRIGEVATWNLVGNYVTVLLIVALAVLPLLIFTNLSPSLMWAIMLCALSLAAWEIWRRKLVV